MFTLFNIATAVTILSKSEQAAHALSFQETGSQDDMDALVRSNMRMAIKIAKRHYRNHLEMDDLVSEAVTGIVRAAETFDPASGASFTSYSSQWMRARVREYVQANTGAVRCGTRTAKALWASLARVRREHGADVTPEFIARELKLDVEEVRDLLPTLTARAISTDAPVGDADGATVGDLMPSAAIDIDEAMDRTRSGELVVEALEEFKNTLNERHQDILARRVLADYMGNDKGDVQSFGVSKQRVSQLEKAVTKKLQAFLTERFGIEALSDMMAK
jgi:RNA polymerase nonessential primary-like sigma factor